MPMFLPVRLTRSSIAPADTAAGMTRPRERCSAHHQDQGLIPLKAGPGLRRLTPIALADTASATTWPVRQWCPAPRQDQKLIPPRAGPGSGREGRALQVGQPPRQRPTPQQRHTAVSTHRRRKQALTDGEHRSRHRLHFSHPQPTRATGSRTGRSGSAATRKSARSKH